MPVCIIPKDLNVSMQKSARSKAAMLYFLLCLIWGSSFILMKIGLFNNQAAPVLTPYQLAALRMASAGVVFIPFVKLALPVLKQASDFIYVLLCALLGSFIPAFLFCMAEISVDSTVAGMLNATTPLFALITGLLFFNQKAKANQVAGIALGLLGCIMLAMGKINGKFSLNTYSLLIVLATICYGTSVNIVKSKLGHVKPLHLTAAIFILLLPLSIGSLLVSGFFSLPLTTAYYTNALLAGSTLGIVGTALATLIFYRLVALAGPILSSMVTYGIPVVAIGWGLLYGEGLTLAQVGCLAIILLGVFLSGWHTLRQQVAKQTWRKGESAA